MKSKVRQLWASLNSWVIRPCWAESVKSRLPLFSKAVRSSVEDSWKISKSWLSRKLEAIFLCFVRLLLASASLIYHKNPVIPILEGVASYLIHLASKL